MKIETVDGKLVCVAETGDKETFEPAAFLKRVFLVNIDLFADTYQGRREVTIPRSLWIALGECIVYGGCCDVKHHCYKELAVMVPGIGPILVIPADA